MGFHPILVYGNLIYKNSTKRFDKIYQIGEQGLNSGSLAYIDYYNNKMATSVLGRVTPLRVNK